MGPPKKPARSGGTTANMSRSSCGLPRPITIDASLVRAVIAVESAFNRYARSHKGAQGLMQLIPETGSRYGVVNPYDPWQNIRERERHIFASLLDEFKDLRLALAAYNAGPYPSTPLPAPSRPTPRPETMCAKSWRSITRGQQGADSSKGGKMYSIGEPGGRTKISVVGNSGHQYLPLGATGSQRSSTSQTGRRARSQARARNAVASPRLRAAPPSVPAAPALQSARSIDHVKTPVLSLP